MNVQVEVRRTDALDEAALKEVRALLDLAFEGTFSAEDWQHTLGGHHALARDGGTLVAHAAVAPRTLWIGPPSGATAYTTGYVEGVAVRSTHRRSGLGTVVMRAVEQVLDRDFELGALSSSTMGLSFYRGLGWSPWRGPTYVAAPGGRERTADDDGAVFVRTTRTALDLDAPITCDWRDGDVW
ncbi:GNAT family N-acetyltransferase [Mumia sp. DW29H23]|uniref:GNAT family N-acetyltransferase n=1 Tax=Mumia sp. DW29H23 TaxID=3421241 RepID=UPI003D689620